MKKGLMQCAVLMLFVSLVGVSGVWGKDGSKFILLSSTIGPIDAGIVKALEDQFEKETGITVRHVGAGTGAALKIAEQGSVDLVMVHAKKLEEAFVAKGFGTERIPLMYNDFVIVGPAADPAGIRGMKTAAEALTTIQAKAAPFISRGDKSGTHVAEMDLWAKAGIQPSGPWYTVYEKGSEGNVPTLKFTDEKNAYTVIDRASYLGLKDKIKLVILVEGDPAMLNHISLIPVSQKKFPGLNSRDTMTFVDWLTSPAKGQKIIEDFGKKEYGQPLFFPESKQWIEKMKTKK
ncbi:MAG TPA: substrate-binding domain-containing protein [Deltaproteobacteria bacterium]|nr:substrate-binding domain-containing protein [Deltaproteobacteria bacterium]